MKEKLLEVNDSFLGYTKGMKPLVEKSRIEKYLKSRIKIDNIIFQKRDFIFNAIREQMKPEESNGSYYIMGSDNSGYIISKTEYNFAEYILNGGFDDAAKVEDQLNIEKTEREIELKAKKARLEQEELKRREEEQFESWLQQATISYDNKEKIEIQKEIFHDVMGFYSENSKRTLVLIDNFDKPGCKKKLLEVMRSDNAATLKTFYHITGIKAPKTNKGIRELLESITSADFKGIVPYKKRKLAGGKEKERFWVARQGEDGKSQFVEVFGEPLNKYGIHMFIHKMDGLTCISSSECGYRIFSAKTKTKVMELLKNFVNENGAQKIIDSVASVGEQKGWSPWSYQQTNK